MNDWYLPLIDSESAPFWRAAKEGRFLIMRCIACQRHYFYPRRYCPRCWSDETEWLESNGRGTVYTYSIVHQNPAPPFSDQVPYAVVIVELDEGVRVMGNWDRSLPFDALACGATVQTVFESITEDVSLVRFRPVE